MNSVAIPERKTVAVLVNDETAQDIEWVHLVKRMLEKTGFEVVFLDEKEYLARSRVEDCDCQMLRCVCAEARKHKPECRWRKTILAPIGFDCEAHGLEECPECDRCTCESIQP